MVFCYIVCAERSSYDHFRERKTPRQNGEARLVVGRGSAVAAATENDDDSENNDPGAVVIKETAEAVVHTFA
jgi:hypothetical protein